MGEIAFCHISRPRRGKWRPNAFTDVAGYAVAEFKKWLSLFKAKFCASASQGIREQTSPLCSKFYLRRVQSPTIFAALLFAWLLPALFHSSAVHSQTTPQLSPLTAVTGGHVVRQQRTASDIVFDLTVVVLDADSNQVAVDDLVLTVVNTSNTVSLRGSTATFNFAGSPPVGTARVEVALLRQGQNGQLQLSIGNLPAQRSIGGAVVSTVTVIAVEDYIGRIDIDAINIPNSFNDGASRSVANWFVAGEHIFSRIDRSADTDTRANRDPSRFLPEMDIVVELSLVNAITENRFFPSLLDDSLVDLTMQVTPGSGLEAQFYGYNLQSDRVLNYRDTIEWTLRGVNNFATYRVADSNTGSDVNVLVDAGLSAWFSAPDSSAPRMATLTVSVVGLPPSVSNHIATSQEFTLIDQALSTITLSVVGEIDSQPVAGAAVAVTVEIHTRGTFGFDYAKYLVLNLLASATESARVASSSVAVNFSNNNPRRATLMVTPLTLDTTLTVTVSREGLAESVAQVPADGLQLNISAAPQLARLELLQPEETTQLRLVDPEIPLEIDFQVRAFDQNGNLADATVMPTAVASAAGSEISISPESLRLGTDGEGDFSITVLPPAGYFAPFTITVSLAGLPPELPGPTLEITISPEIDTPTVVIAAGGPIQQSLPLEEIVFDVAVHIWGADGMRIGHPGLVLLVSTGTNTTVGQRTWPVTFSPGADGQAVGTVSIRAGLMVPGEDGSVVLGIAGADDLVLLSPRTVRLAAAAFRGFVGIDLDLADSIAPSDAIGNHYVFENNTVDVSQVEPLRIFKRDNLAGFSASRTAGNPNAREFALDIQVYDAAGQSVSLAPSPQGNFSLNMTTGAGISLGSLLTNVPALSSLGRSTELVYNANMGFINREFNTALHFVVDLQDAVVSAMMTLSVSGLPDDLVPLSREFVFIDQLLSTVTLSVDGEVAVQTTPGATVAVHLRVDARGTLGYPYRKSLALNLMVTTSTADVALAPIPVLNFSGDSPRTVTLQVRPTGIDDVVLTVMLENLPEGVALVTEGLPLTVAAARQLASVQLRPLSGSTEVTQTDAEQPVHIGFEVSGFDRDGIPIDGQLMARVRASIAGTGLVIDRPLLTLVAGVTSFVLSVTPAGEEPFTVTVLLSSLPSGQEQAALELTIIPVNSRLDLDGDYAVALDELLLIQRWLETGRPDLTANGATGATGAAGNANLEVDSVDAASFSNLLELYTDRSLDVDGNGTVDELDLRILLRYRAGLRGAALGADGANISEEQIRLLLGLPAR